MTIYIIPLLKKYWRIAHPYWFSQERWKAIRSLILLIFLSLISTLLLLIFSIFLGEITSVLSNKNPSEFAKISFIFLGLIILGVPLLSYKIYLQAILSLHWRNWLTNYFLKIYFKDFNFYHVNFHAYLDNPDQRIAEDIKNFTYQSINFVILVLDAILQLIGFTGLLWSISKTLMTFLILYALIGTVLTGVVFGRIFIGINLEQLKREADFRFGLVRIRENAEAIAFYEGENTEKIELQALFSKVFQNFVHLLQWSLSLNIFQNGYQYITFILPGLILAPQILSGELEIGEFSKAGVAFRSILIALAFLITQFDELSTFAAGVTRLDDLFLLLDKPQVIPGGIEIIESSTLAFCDVTLQTPNAETTLVKGLSFAVPLGEGLLVVGPSGVGKSSLLRALAGLWKSGVGSIHRPKKEEIMFLPQRPYLIIGSLREQLLYPSVFPNYSDEQLLEALEAINLADIVARFGGLDRQRNWTNILSLGEQQRLAFGRLWLNRPQFVILDEATSALDSQNEDRLYQYLQKTSTTFISVGHRSSLLPYHQQILRLSGNGEWQLRQVAIGEN